MRVKGIFLMMGNAGSNIISRMDTRAAPSVAQRWVYVLEHGHNTFGPGNGKSTLLQLVSVLVNLVSGKV